jgi:hypothetical protein
MLAPLLGVLGSLLVDQLGFLAAFVLGFLYSFSFAGGFATLMLLSADAFTTWYVFVAACGAMCADFALIKFIQLELTDEFSRFFNEPFMRRLIAKCSWLSPAPLRVALGVFCIGSPLPDELGVLLLSQMKELSTKTMLALSFAANFVGLYIVGSLL